MFHVKRIKELEKELLDLRGKILDLTCEVEVLTHIYLDGGYSDTKKIHVVTVLEDLLRALGYRLTYEYTPEEEKVSLKKVKTKKKIK